MPECFEEACRLGVEGVVAKRRASPYLGGRSTSWLKLKCFRRERFVVAGFTGSRGLSSLVLGYFDKGGVFHFGGRVKMGFTANLRTQLLEQLRKLIRKRSPFGLAQESHAGAIWVRPVIVVEVSYLDRTQAGSLRHASFKRVCEEVTARAIVRTGHEATTALGKRKA